MAFLEPRVFLQTLHHSSVSWNITLLYFLIKIFICFGQKDPIKVQISFRLSTARMKKNQIPYVIFQAICQFFFKFCITFQCHDTQFLWNIICFGQKEPINVEFFRLLNALMKVHPIPHAIFETTKSRFIQILHHWSVSWKITPMYFF